jgi:transposase
VHPAPLYGRNGFSERTIPRGQDRIHLQTILNRVQRHKSFVYGRAQFREAHGVLTLEVTIEARGNGRPLCSGCGKAGPGYDRLAARRFQFVPLWGMAVFFSYALRRVACPRCGVKAERVPWASGKGRLTTAYEWFLARWAKRLAWQEVADIFHTSWNTVYRAVTLAVLYGIANRSLEGITAIGVDEIQWRKGHKYLTLVYQIQEGCKRLLYVAADRTEASLGGFFGMLGQARSAALAFACSDMWKPYLNVIAACAGQAVHVLDRYHVMAKLNKAIDEVRAEEAKRLKRDGYEPVLKHSRWVLLKRPENLTEQQSVKLQELLKYNLKSVRAYLLREEFQRFWEYRSAYWAGRFLREWCAKALRSRIEPLKKAARMLRSHEGLLLNWFRAQGTISAGTVEGLNYKAKLAMRKAYGFRTLRGVKIALYHRLGALPEPNFTHEFC